MTGLWQLYARNTVEFHNGIELDREYVEKQNLGLDMKILAGLFKTVLLSPEKL